MWLPSCLFSAFSWSKYFVPKSCCSSVSSTINIDSSLSRMVLYFPSFLSLDSASSVWCLMTASWTTSKSRASSRYRHFVKFPESPADISNYFKASWSVCIMKPYGSRNSRRSDTAYTTARHSLLVVASFCSGLGSMRDLYATGCAVMTSCFDNSTHPFWDSHASVFSEE